MNERNVASGADSLYPRGRVWNMSSRDSRAESEYREKERERQKKEREDSAAFAKKLENPASASEAKIKALQDRLEGGLDAEYRALPGMREREEYFRTGVLEDKDEKPLEPLVSYEGQSQRIRPHVIEDASGATAIETSHLLQMLDRDVAIKALKDLGLGDVNLPEKWDSMDVIHRARWLQDKQEIFSFQRTEMDDVKDLMLPAIGGGSGEIYWDDTTMESYEVEVIDPSTGRRVQETHQRKIGAEESIRRLVILNELSGKHEDTVTPPGKSITEQLKELTDHFKLNYLDKIDEAITKKKDFDKVSELGRVATSMARKYELVGREKTDVFNKVISFDLRDKAREAKRELDKHFQKIKDSDPQRYKDLFRSVDEEAEQVNQIQNFGYYGRADDQREKFKRAAKIELDKAINDEEREMLKWRIDRLEEGFDLRYTEIGTNQPPADWRDSEYNLDRIIRSLESTDFDDQQLNNIHQSATRIITTIPINTLKGEEKEEAEKKKKELEEKLQSIIAFNTFYGAMQHADMNPEKVLGAFGHLEDNTFEIFFERFSKDSKGHHLFIDDKEGAHAEDREKLNLLSVGMNVYMKRLNFERRVMNFVENWTKNPGLQPKFDDKELEAACGAAMHVIKGEMDKSSLKDSIAKWYRENTMLGAHDEHTKEIRKEEMVGNKKFKDGKPDGLEAHGVKLWEKGLIEELRAHKDEWKLSDEKIQEMIDSGTIDQVMNNAYRLSWMTAWSDYDGIRVWDPNAENPVKPGGRQVAFVYNASTHMFHGRMIDHAWEFFVDESRGKVAKSNLIMQDELLGEHGNLLPQNRTMVRFARMLLGNENTDAYIGQKSRGFKNIDKFDPNSKEEMGWAESAVLSEGIDNGELSFDNANWMSFFKSTNSWKYRWIDLFGDRKSMMDYMGAGVLQKYLQQPNSEMFFQINSLENFYSKREVRLQPWMKLAIGAHQKIGDHWKEWWGLSERMTHAEKEAVIEIAAATNRLDPKYKNSMKHSHLGWGGMPGVLPVRSFRQLSEAADIFAREMGTGVPKNAWRAPVAWGNAFFSQGMKYIFS